MKIYQKIAIEFHERFINHWEQNGCFQKKCITVMDLCDDTLQKLKALVLDKEFENVSDEILFFKDLKPQILSVKFACRGLMEFEFEKAINQDKLVADIQQICLNRLQEKFNSFKDFRYYLCGSSTNRDEQYFTIDGMKDDYILRFIPEVEKGFSTGYDILLAYSKAIEFMKDYFEEEVPTIKQITYPELQWTGNKTDLVELLATLHRTNVFNNGENEFKRFVITFSKIVNFEIKDVYRTVSAIKDRKKENKSFLSRMIFVFQEMLSDAHK